MIINETFCIKDECVKKFLENFEIEVKKAYLKYEIIFKKNKHISKHLYCIECAGANLGINLHKKGGAVEMGKLISDKFLPKEEIMRKLIKCPICDNPKHTLIYCSETDEVYIKSIIGVLPQDICYSLSNEIALLLNPQIEIFESFLDSVNQD
jgi:hypothetical protein